MKHLWLVFALGFLPTFVLAQDDLPRIDYEALFRLHADQVIVIDQGNLPPIRKLYMPGEVVLKEWGPPDDRRYSGTDKSGDGAMGCIFILVLDAVVIAEMCPGYVNSEQLQAGQDRLKMISRFVGENSVPPVVGDDLEQTLEKLISSRKSYWESEPNICERNELVLSSGVFHPDMAEEFEAGFGPPRLPVGNPCL